MYFLFQVHYNTARSEDIKENKNEDCGQNINFPLRDVCPQAEMKLFGKSNKLYVNISPGLIFSNGNEE